MKNIISSFSRFEEHLEGNPVLNKESKRLNALKKYFASGGVVSIVPKENTWPKLLYPNTSTLQHRMKRFKDQREKFAIKKKMWDKKLSDSKSYFVKQNFLKLKEPLYWKHAVKKIIDSDYNKDASTVQLPVNLVADPRWKPMVKTFVNDIEYRKQLTETVNTSVVYKNDKKVAKYAGELQDFRAGVANKKLEFLNTKISELDAIIETLNHMVEWAKEN